MSLFEADAPTDDAGSLPPALPSMLLTHDGSRSMSAVSVLLIAPRSNLCVHLEYNSCCMQLGTFR